MKLVLFGPPGSGKGTQAQLIKEQYGIAHISTGDLFRKNIAEGTALGMLAKSYIDKGDLVPDEVTINMLKERLAQDDCQGGYILDGFPRNIYQAEQLDKITDVDLAILINQKDEVIIPRLSGRRTCRLCGYTTHINWLEDKNKEVCAKCFGPLYQRDDDKEDVIKNRLDGYRKQTAPLTDYYKAQGKLEVVQATNEVDQTYALVNEVLSKSEVL